jgi:hypothetical protein
VINGFDWLLKTSLSPALHNMRWAFSLLRKSSSLKISTDASAEFFTRKLRLRLVKNAQPARFS